MSAEAPAFVDTNVLVYACGGEDPKQAVGAKLLAHLIDTDRLRLSTQVFQEFYVTVTRKIKRPLSPRQALDIMDDLSIWPVVRPDYPLIRQAVSTSNDSQISFWDALLIAAAS